MNYTSETLSKKLLTSSAKSNITQWQAKQVYILLLEMPLPSGLFEVFAHMVELLSQNLQQGTGGTWELTWNRG